MTYETLLFEVSDGLAKITLNRPGAANSLNGAMAHDLMMAAIRCDEDPDIRAVLLTATGKMFCAGGDLKTFHGFGVKDEHGPRQHDLLLSQTRYRSYGPDRRHLVRRRTFCSALSSLPAPIARLLQLLLTLIDTASLVPR